MFDIDSLDGVWWYAKLSAAALGRRAEAGGAVHKGGGVWCAEQEQLGYPQFRLLYR